MAAPPNSIAPILCVWALILTTGGCVTIDLREATTPYVGREKPGAPTIALVDVADRRDDPTRFGRAGYTVLSFSGDAGHKFRNAMIGALDRYGYDVRYVGQKNVLDPAVAAAAVREAETEALLTAAVLELRLYSTDILFDPADVDFVAQVNLLDGEGRTVYTRHVHSRDDKRLWFNPGFGAMDMLDEVMDDAAAFVARDPELWEALHGIRMAKERAARGEIAPLSPAATLAPGERIVVPEEEDGAKEVVIDKPLASPGAVRDVEPTPDVPEDNAFHAPGAGKERAGEAYPAEPAAPDPSDRPSTPGPPDQPDREDPQ